LIKEDYQVSVFIFFDMANKEKRSEVDIVNTVLEDCIVAYPVSSLSSACINNTKKEVI
jgi:hypothetical protein